METIEPSETNVALEVNGVTVDMNVIGKDAEIELNNNEMVKSDVTFIKSEEPENLVVDDDDKKVVDDDEKSVEPEDSSTDTNNGDEKSVDNNPAEGDSKVDDASESSNAKSEQSDASTNESTGTEATDETANSKNDANNLENKPASSEQSNDGETKNDENNGTLSASANETSDDAEQSGDAAATSSKNASPKKSPRKKTSTKKRKSRSRSQKKGFDYSQFVNYALSVSQRQRRFFLQVTRGRVPVPDDDCEIFVSNIPINVLEPELIPLFERFGKIFELRLMMSMRNPKRNAGFAFVRFTASESATEATEKLNDYEIVPGKHLAIRLSQPNLSLFVGNIHRGLTREQIHEKISNKTAGLVKTFVKSSLYEDTKNCGFCFLEYECHSAALKAKRLLNQGNVWGRQLFVDWAQRRKQFDESDRQESKTLFINYLPKEITDQQIIDALSSFGNIEKVTKIKDYAFVLFAEHEAAMNALDDADKSKFGNDSVEISLAMPKKMKSRNRVPSFAYRRPRQSRRNDSYNRFKPSFGASNKFYLRKNGDAHNANDANNFNNTNSAKTEQDATANTTDNTAVNTADQTAVHTAVEQTTVEQTIIPAVIVTAPEPLPVN